MPVQAALPVKTIWRRITFQGVCSVAPIIPPGGPLPVSQSQQNQLGVQPPIGVVTVCGPAQGQPAARAS